MDYFLQNVINALQWGSFYAVISIGYSMVYGVLMLFNFAHGDIFMVGTYIGFGIATLLLVTTTAVAAIAAVGLSVFRGVIEDSGAVDVLLEEFEVGLDVFKSHGAAIS